MKVGAVEAAAAGAGAAGVPGRSPGPGAAALCCSVLRGALCPLLGFRKERFTLKLIKKFISTGTK